MCFAHKITSKNAKWRARKFFFLNFQKPFLLKFATVIYDPIQIQFVEIFTIMQWSISKKLIHSRLLVKKTIHFLLYEVNCHHFFSMP